MLFIGWLEAIHGPFHTMATCHQITVTSQGRSRSTRNRGLLQPFIESPCTLFLRRSVGDKELSRGVDTTSLFLKLDISEASQVVREGCSGKPVVCAHAGKEHKIVGLLGNRHKIVGEKERGREEQVWVVHEECY